MTYGTGAVSGNIVQDNLAFAGFQLPDHTFGVALTEDDLLTGAPFNGLMVLAQNINSVFSLLDTLHHLLLVLPYSRF